MMRDVPLHRSATALGALSLLAAATLSAPPLQAAGPAGTTTPAIALPQLGDPHLTVVPRTVEETARIQAITAPTTEFDAPEPFEARPAGAATVRARKDDEAYSQHSAGLTFEEELEFKLGNGLFKKVWVPSPASAPPRARGGAPLKPPPMHPDPPKDRGGPPAAGPAL
jgi:hypothetical protein